MYARLSYCGTDHGQLPSAVICHSREQYINDGDCDELILAHREDDGDIRGMDFVCPDEPTAWRLLRETVSRRYRNIRIEESH